MFDLVTISEALKKYYNREGILIDVRDEEAYRTGHLPGAVHVPLDDIMEEKYHPQKGKILYLYCDTGSSSLMAARKLDEDGFQVYSVAGGISSYRGRLDKEEVDTFFSSQ